MALKTKPRSKAVSKKQMSTSLKKSNSMKAYWAKFTTLGRKREWARRTKVKNDNLRYGGKHLVAGRKHAAA